MRIAILGGFGHVGRAVCEKLKAADHDIVVPAKADYDVSRRHHNIPAFQGVEAVIYCVGHCPPGGFAEAMKNPLSSFPDDEFESEIGMHIRGPLYTFQDFVGVLPERGRFVFMSSAATRLLQMPLEKRPPIQIYHHLAAIAAEDALIEGMRMDPMVKTRGITVHRVMPPAIGDSPFHEGGPKLSVSVLTEKVVDAIAQCLGAELHQDLNLVPPSA